MSLSPHFFGGGIGFITWHSLKHESHQEFLCPCLQSNLNLISLSIYSLWANVSNIKPKSETPVGEGKHTHPPRVAKA